MEYIEKKCLFCGEKEKEQEEEKVEELYPRNFQDSDLTPEVFSARRRPDHFHYRIVRCGSCGLVFSREILPQAELERLYSQSAVTFNQYAPVIRRDYWRFLRPYIDRIERGRALEIGCSNGFFLEELLAQGFQEVYGCEPSYKAKAEAAKSVQNNIFSGVFKTGVYERDHFDLVCSFQTLDHLADPAEAVRITREILKPGGLAYFITHNVDSFQARLLRENSPIFDVEHIYLFNKKTLARLFEKSGFEIVTVGNIKNSYPLEYWLEMLSLDKLSAAAKVLKVGNVRLPIAAGNIGIIAYAR